MTTQDSFEDFPEGATKIPHNILMANLERKKSLMAAHKTSEKSESKWSSMVYEEAFGVVDKWMSEKNLKMSGKIAETGAICLKSTNISLNKPVDFSWNFFDSGIPSGYNYDDEVESMNRAKTSTTIPAKVGTETQIQVFTSTQLPQITPDSSLWILPNSQISPIRCSDDSGLDTTFELDDSKESVKNGNKTKKKCCKRLFSDDSFESSSLPEKKEKRSSLKKKKSIVLTFDETEDEFSQVTHLDDSEYSPSNQSILAEKRTKRNNRNWSSKRNKWAIYDSIDEESFDL